MSKSLIKLWCYPCRKTIHLVYSSSRAISLYCNRDCKQRAFKPFDDKPKRYWHKQSNFTVWVPDKPRTKRPVKEDISEGLDIIRKGIPQWKQEWKDRLEADFNFIPEHGDYEYLVQFNGPDSIKDWLVSTDRDTSCGKSTASLTVNPNTYTALFQGFLNTDLPKDGEHKNAGFCNIRSPLKKKSFEREIPYDWSRYTHMFLKVRGDGRNYMLNVHMKREFSHHWYDMYHYPLYTRGGPYWQITKVPFAKFFLAHSSRVQDVQEIMDLDQVKAFSISMMDGVKGRFSLEIDSIALVRDESQDNTFAYEMYSNDGFA